jgi:hypothetical protein
MLLDAQPATARVDRVAKVVNPGLRRSGSAVLFFVATEGIGGQNWLNG